MERKNLFGSSCSIATKKVCCFLTILHWVKKPKLSTSVSLCRCSKFCTHSTSSRSSATGGYALITCFLCLLRIWSCLANSHLRTKYWIYSHYLHPVCLHLLNNLKSGISIKFKLRFLTVLWTQIKIVFWVPLRAQESSLLLCSVSKNAWRNIRNQSLCCHSSLFFLSKQ